MLMFYSRMWLKGTPVQHMKRNNRSQLYCICVLISDNNTNVTNCEVLNTKKIFLCWPTDWGTSIYGEERARRYYKKLRSSDGLIPTVAAGISIFLKYTNINSTQYQLYLVCVSWIMILKGQNALHLIIHMCHVFTCIW